MEKDKKKKYEKCAVLGFCKTPGSIGPGVPMCGLPFAPCFGNGS